MLIYITPLAPLGEECIPSVVGDPVFFVLLDGPCGYRLLLTLVCVPSRGYIVSPMNLGLYIVVRLLYRV
jgi:hypothetical protein